MTFGPNTRRGVIDLVANNLLNFRCLCMYDSEASFNEQDDDNSVMAIFDNSTLLDFNRIVSQESQFDQNGLDIELI